MGRRKQAEPEDESTWLRQQDEEERPLGPEEQVVAWMLEGHDEFRIRDSFADLFPGLDPALALESVFNHFYRVGHISPDALQATLGWCIEASKDVYRDMRATGEFAGALRAIKQVKELVEQANGLYREPDQPADDPADDPDAAPGEEPE